jgi:excinuclease ABC subunit A
VRTTLEVRGARVNNLKNIHVEIPRNELVVLTGLSGSGKSSLAFETIYAEGQRRFMESLSTYAKRFVQQLKKPDVDFVYGLSPVISIDQKTVGHNPRSTVGTMTDLSNYLQLLYATIGQAHCPFCNRQIPTKTPIQMAEHILSLPQGTEIEVRAPLSKVYGEDYEYLLGEIRGKGYRWLLVDGERVDMSETVELDDEVDYALEVVVDKFVVKTGIDKNLIAAIENAKVVGEGFLHVAVVNSEEHDADAFYSNFGCPEHHLAMVQVDSSYFRFNDPLSACVTCSGLGTYLQVHPDLLVPDKTRSILDGAFVREAFTYNRDTHNGIIVWSLANHFGFSLDTPFQDLPEAIQHMLLYGLKGEKIPMVLPPGAKPTSKWVDRHIGKPVGFDGIAVQIERHYRWYRKRETAQTNMEDWLRKVMVERTCPDCHGTRLKPQRLLVTVNDVNIHQVGDMPLEEAFGFLNDLVLPEKTSAAGRQVLSEITARMKLLLDIGLDYLSLNRPSGTLSGGEAQRIRLSTQIGSGLMGMLYVLDEPSIGLHPKDNEKMIATLRHLRDIGNSVIVVEHDEDTMRAADHIIEIGPGPGVHGGEIVAQGTIEDILASPDSLTGQYLSGRKRIELPESRRKPRKGKSLWIRGARENNLRNVDVEIPLGVFVCITGASGSGKSTLIHDVLYKKLYSIYHDSRVLSGKHDSIEGHEQVSDVILVDQSPIGRNSRSNPATYIGVYDHIRQLFASTDESKARRYTAGRFSFNVKGGRCEECSGEGVITTQLHFMPDVEVPCLVCKGARFNAETLEVTYKRRNIAEVLDMPIEEAVGFFAEAKVVSHKLGILNDLGLGYLTVGQSSTTLSGGEAQRVKLGFELGKIKRGAHNLYILDEPTTGLHLADIQRLLDSLNRLVNAGNTVIVIEHHLDVIKTADWVIDLGPLGGHNGGEVIAAGTPEEIVGVERSYTAKYLKPYLAPSL